MTLIAVWIDDRSSTPAKTPESRPEPPLRLTPPITTAAKAWNSMPMPRLAVAPAVREASSQPAKPASMPERMNEAITIAPTLMPAR